MKSKYFILLFLIILCSCSKKQEQKVEPLSKNAIETAKLYENEYIIKKQIEIYEKIVENKIWKYQ